jgi:F-type H+-transporting ATPase subunit b
MRHALLLLACFGLLLSSGASLAQDEAAQDEQQIHSQTAPVPVEEQMRGADETVDPYAVEQDAEEVQEDVVEAADLAHHDGHAAEGKGGLPQFDPTWFPSQLFWLVVTFVVLYTVMTTTVLPALTKTVEGRRTKIETDLKAAETLSAQAHQLSETVGRQLQSAHAEAVSIIAHAGHEISEDTAARQHDFQERAHGRHGRRHHRAGRRSPE